MRADVAAADVTAATGRADAAPRLRLRCPAGGESLRGVRGRVRRWADDHGLSADVLIDLQLALGEAVANGIEHAYPTDGARSADASVDLELELRAGSGGAVVAARVTDRGRWRPVPADPGDRGRGLALIERLSQDMRVHPGRHGTEVTFAIAVPEGCASPAGPSAAPSRRYRQR